MRIFGRNYGYTPGPLAGKSQHVAGLCDVSSFAESEGAGRIVLLYKYLETLLRRPVQPRDQGSSPTCVAQSAANAIDLLQAIAAVVFGKQLTFQHAEPNGLYALARVEVGYGRYESRPRGDGTWPRLMAEACRDFGSLAMRPYPSIDLSKFDPELYRKWGKSGLPDELEPQARLHVISKSVSVKSYEEVRAAIANGLPVIVGSNQGFKGGIRDSDGFMKPRGSWAHCMTVIGCDDAYSRPGVLIWNSWGKTPAGPTRHGQPEGSFWCDADVIDSMVRKGEGEAMAGFNGFNKSPTALDYKLI